MFQNQCLKGLSWHSTRVYISAYHVSCFMMALSNGNIFRLTGHLCREFTGRRWIPRRKASDAELWCFFYLRPNKRLSKRSWGWWFETPSRSLWRHCNVLRCPPTLCAMCFGSITGAILCKWVLAHVLLTKLLSKFKVHWQLSMENWIAAIRLVAFSYAILHRPR